MSLATPRPVNRAVSFVQAVVGLYRERDIAFMAGSVAYASFVSLIPLFLLLFIAASIFGGETLQTYLLALTEQYLTPTSQGILQESIAHATERVGFSLFGLVTLLWAVLKVFRSLDTAFSVLYGTEGHSGFLDQVEDGIVVVGAMTVGILTMVGIGTVIALAPDISVDFVPGFPLLRILGYVVLIIGLVVAFVPMYYVFPDVSVTVREVIPGAIVAALGWAALQALFQVYATMSSASQLYGVIGGVILIITWLYFGAVILLLGAATNIVLAGRDRPDTYRVAP